MPSKAKGLDQAGYETSPLEDGSLKSYRVHKVPMTKLTRLSVEGLELSQKEKDRCRNFFAMGLVFWLYDRPLEPTLRYIDDKFGKKPEIAQANTAAFKAGYHYGETVEAINTQFHVPKAKLTPGKYTSIVGNTALAYGLMAAARRAASGCFWAPIRSRRPATSCTSWPGTRTSTSSRSRPRTKSPR